MPVSEQPFYNYDLEQKSDEWRYAGASLAVTPYLPW